MENLWTISGPKYIDFETAILAKPLLPIFSRLQSREITLNTQKEENIDHRQAFFRQRGRGHNQRVGRHGGRGRGFQKHGKVISNNQKKIYI